MEINWDQKCGFRVSRKNALKHSFCKICKESGDPNKCGFTWMTEEGYVLGKTHGGGNMDVEERLALLEKDVKDLKLQMTVLDLQHGFKVKEAAEALKGIIKKENK